jgi:hypothetical protein
LTPPPPLPHPSSICPHLSLFPIVKAFSFGLADIVAREGESAAAAAVRILCPDPALHSNVIFGVKRAVTCETAMQETKVFEGLWGQDAHLAAFATALRKNKSGSYSGKRLRHCLNAPIVFSTNTFHAFIHW